MQSNFTRLRLSHAEGADLALLAVGNLTPLVPCGGVFFRYPNKFVSCHFILFCVGCHPCFKFKQEGNYPLELAAKRTFRSLLQVDTEEVVRLNNEILSNLI